MSLVDRGGGVLAPPWDPILSFSHSFSPKSTHAGGPRPLTDARPPTGNPGSATACYLALPPNLVLINKEINLGVLPTFKRSNQFNQVIDSSLMPHPPALVTGTLVLSTILNPLNFALGYVCAHMTIVYVVRAYTPYIHKQLEQPRVLA